MVAILPDTEDLEDWASDEFSGAQLGDARRTQRLVALARGLAQKAHVSFPQALS
ncbi:transposase DNA-binding-containing protein, partial [Cupriavidus sp. TA19]